jgi:hypothetical protein
MAISYKRQGAYTEQIMNFILDHAGFQDLSVSEYSAALLLDTVEKIRPGRLTSVESKIKKFLGWKAYKPKFILDHVFGLDYILSMDPTGQKIAFDFTVDREQVESKVSKLKEFKPLWAALGIEKIVVLTIIYPEGEDQGLLFYDAEDAVQEIYGVLYDAIESSLDVTTAELKVKLK